MWDIKKIHEHLIEIKKTLSLAESCTGGHLSARFTAIPDASKYFLGSLVTYSNHSKHKLLDVSEETLLTNGAASRETAHEMLIGLMKKMESDYGIALTGVAGPTGGTKEKPIGTVFIAFGMHGKKPHVIECHFEGDRKAVIAASCDRALSELAFLLEINS